MKLHIKLILGALGIGVSIFILQGFSVDQAYLAGKAPDKVISWISVLPPLIAVVFAYISGRIILSLAGAVVLGAFMASSWHPVQSVVKTGHEYIWGSLNDEFHFLTIVFIVTMVGMVGVISRMGGTQGVINLLAKRANTAKGASIVTAIMGVLLFFDDYANSILVGSTARPLTDQYKVSREKLAYLVDSTAAPIAGLAVLSTWIGYEAGLFQEALNGLGVSMSGYEAFFHALPFRFYCIFTLIFVFVNVIMDRDFGPMHRAQKRSLTTGKVSSDDAELKSSTAVEKTKVRKGIVPRWHNAVIPLTVVILVMWVGFYYSGATALKIPLRLGDLFHFDTLRRCFSEANNIRVLALGGGMGLFCSVLLAVTQNILSLKQSVVAFWHSFKAILIALTILVLAWAIQKTCDDLGTSIYLSALLKDVVSPMMLPVVIFLLAGVIAFSTGTSWGTMAILIPTAVPLTYQIGGLGLSFIAMAAVLDGAIFGDHCSPVSDTTLMSSIASSCDHMHHVKTQMPYAVVSMLLALLLGYIPAVLDWSLWVSVAMGFAAILGIFMVFGKPNPKKS